MPGGRGKIKGSDNTNGFQKNPGNINKQGAPKTKDLKEKIQAALDNPGNILFIGELQYECDKDGNQIKSNLKKGTLVKVKVEVPNEDMIILAMVKQSMKGNVTAIKELWDRVWGKSKQGVELSNPDGSMQQYSNLTYEQLYELKYGHKP